MDVLLLWLESINYLDILFYWFFLIFIEFFCIWFLFKNHEFDIKKLSLNFWLPFGVIVPATWLLRVKEPLLIDVICVISMSLFYIVLSPFFYRNKKGKNT